MTTETTAIPVTRGNESDRRSPRHRTFKGAHICFRGLNLAIDCVVRDYSDTGARLQVESLIGIPDRFDLVRDNFPMRVCRVIWRRAPEIGVEFLG